MKKTTTIDKLKGSPYVRVIKKVNDPRKWRNEKDFQKAVVKLFTDNGWKVAAFNETGRRTWKGNIGWPDLFLVKARQLIALELKYGRGSTTFEQDEWLICLGKAGVRWIVAWPLDWQKLERLARGEE